MGIDNYYNCSKLTGHLVRYCGGSVLAARSSLKLTKFELEVMDALWQLGRGSVREILERLPAERRPAYTTVQTIVFRLEEKGALKRLRKVGNAHVFEPVITRSAAGRTLVDELLSFFGGSVPSLMSHLVQSGKLSLKDIRQLEDSLAALNRETGGDQITSTKTVRRSSKAKE
jgi:BlaI family transcriptional regulator, penicillinase repressor